MTETETGKYMIHRLVPTKGETEVVLTGEASSDLEQFVNIYSLEAVLLGDTNANNRCKGSLKLFKRRTSIGSYMQLTVNYIRMNYNSVLFLHTLRV